MRYTVFLFPGQGAQFPEFLGRLPSSQIVKQTLSQASEVLGVDVLGLDSSGSLKSNVAVQLCLYTAGVASFRHLTADGFFPNAVAGLSIGAFAAATACGTLPFSDGLRLVKKRAELMEARYPNGFGMSAIVGLSETRVKQLVAEICSSGQQIYLSNINAPQQITVSGENRALTEIELRATESGARKVERLAFNVPSHCSLYEEEAQILLRLVREIDLSKPNFPYLSNIRARALSDAKAIGEDIAQNIAHGVRWHDAIAVLVEMGTELFVEMAPGSTLSELCKHSFPEKRTIPFELCTPEWLSNYVSA